MGLDLRSEFKPPNGSIRSERIFSEKASGAQRERPELMKAIEYMREGDILVVWKLDRLARSLKQLIETVHLLESRNIGIRSLTEAIDSSTSGGKLIFHIFGAPAEFERSIIKERTMAGLEPARKAGRKGGRPPALSAIDLESAKSLLKDSKHTVDEIAEHLGISSATLYGYFPGGRSETI